MVSHYHYFSTQVKTFPTLQSVTCCSQTSLWVREREGWILVNEGMSWVTEIGEIPVMTSFTLQQLSLTRLLTFTSEMKWQPQPAAHVLSGLIRSEAFNANLLWTFHLYHSLCPEYNCIYNQWYFIQTQPRWRFVSYYLFCFCIVLSLPSILEKIKWLHSVKRKILSFQGGDDLMRRYLDMLTLLRTAGGRYQSSYLLPSRILKTLKRTNQVRKINSAFDVSTFLSKWSEESSVKWNIKFRGDLSQDTTLINVAAYFNYCAQTLCVSEAAIRADWYLGLGNSDGSSEWSEWWE